MLLPDPVSQAFSVATRHVHDVKRRQGRQALRQGADVTLSFSLWASYEDGTKDTGEVKDRASHEPTFV